LTIVVLYSQRKEMVDSVLRGVQDELDLQVKQFQQSHHRPSPSLLQEGEDLEVNSRMIELEQQSLS
jgi:hypothetical protein